jgi:hypothetical protein
VDCADQDGAVYPGAAQVCDGKNDDCNDPAWPAIPAAEADADGDGVRACAGDCDDADPAVFPGAPEINDGEDNQCPGDPGYGQVDEIPWAGFADPADETAYSWSAQPGATLYEVVRSLGPGFGPDCRTFSVAATVSDDAETPASSACFYYLVRAAAPHAGTFGVSSAGQERFPICATP